MNINKPIVFLLDIDGTILGNIGPQVSIYDLKLSNHVNINYTVKDLLDRFDKGLLRPYFEAFIKQTQRRLPNAEFFIYTAADNRWGTFISSVIEKHIDFKFNKPIFTRKHCFNIDHKIVKSIKHITPSIKRSLSKKYGKQCDLTNRIIMIDNSVVFQENEMKQVLICNTYNNIVPENIPVYINEIIFNQYKSSIETRLHKLIPNISTKNYIEFQKTFYAYYIHALQKYTSHVPQDRFWFYLNRLLEIKNITLFTPNTIEYINSKLSKRL